MNSFFLTAPTKRFWVAAGLLVLPIMGCSHMGFKRKPVQATPINAADNLTIDDATLAAKYGTQSWSVPQTAASTGSFGMPRSPLATVSSVGFSPRPVTVAHRQPAGNPSENFDWQAENIETVVLPATSMQAAEADKERAIEPESAEASEANTASKTQQSIAVEMVVNEALARHPKIIAARQRVASASNVIPQVGALPDPTFNNTFWPLHDNALQTAGGRVANQMSLSQGIPFPEKLRAKVAIASREVQIAQAEVDSLEREIEKAVRLSYYEVWYNTRALAIIDESKTLVDELITIAQSRFRTGGSQQDVLRAQLESDRLEQQRIAIVEKQKMAMADLATLLQQPTQYQIQPTEELQPEDVTGELNQLIELAQQCNPKLRGLAAEVQRDRQRQRLACLQQYPDFNVGLNWGLISDSHDVISPVADGHDNLSITFGTTLPIWRDKINAGVREAAHRTNSTSQRFSAERDELFGKIRRLLAQADALAQQRSLYRDRMIPRAEDTLKLTIADYGGNRTDFFSVIDTYRELLLLEMQLVRLDASLAGIVAELDSVVGCMP